MCLGLIKIDKFIVYNNCVIIMILVFQYSCTLLFRMTFTIKFINKLFERDETFNLLHQLKNLKGRQMADDRSLPLFT